MDSETVQGSYLLTISRHSDSVTQKKWGFLVKPGLWAKAGHPLSSNPRNPQRREGTFSASQPLKQQPCPLASELLLTSLRTLREERIALNFECSKLHSHDFLTRGLPHQPLLIRTGSSESGWLASCRRGQEAELQQQLVEVTRSVFSSLFSCPPKQHFE